MKSPFVIAINSVSGGGKTELSKLIHKNLDGSLLFSFDDFEESNIYPKDYYDWYVRGANVLEFDCPGMAEIVGKAIAENSVKYIILDYPFGRKHPRFAQQIDLSIYIDTPLDVAMARRILRSGKSDSKVSAELKFTELQKDLSQYLEKGRYPYLESYKHKEASDLVLDGWNSLESNCEKVLSKLK